jgi:hypothetical protein
LVPDPPPCSPSGRGDWRQVFVQLARERVNEQAATVLRAVLTLCEPTLLDGTRGRGAREAPRAQAPPPPFLYTHALCVRASWWPLLTGEEGGIAMVLRSAVLAQVETVVPTAATYLDVLARPAYGYLLPSPDQQTLHVGTAARRKRDSRPRSAQADGRRMRCCDRCGCDAARGEGTNHVRPAARPLWRCGLPHRPSLAREAHAGAEAGRLTRVPRTHTHTRTWGRGTDWGHGRAWLAGWQPGNGASGGGANSAVPDDVCGLCVCAGAGRHTHRILPTNNTSTYTYIHTHACVH